MNRRNWLWGLLAAALLLPAVGFASKALSDEQASCPIGCDKCPLKQKCAGGCDKCPLKK